MNDARLEYVRLWYKKADEDIYVAQQLIQDETYTPTSAICFHCQQCAEKYLKGLLLFRGVEFPKSHDLVHLIGLLADQQLVEEVLEKANALNDYAIEPRYPGDLCPLSLAEATEALENATAIRKIVLSVTAEVGYKSFFTDGEIKRAPVIE